MVFNKESSPLIFKDKIISIAKNAEYQKELTIISKESLADCMVIWFDSNFIGNLGIWKAGNVK